MTKRFIILIAMIVIFLPSILIPITVLLLEYFANVLLELPISIALDLPERMTSGEYIALYFSLLGVIATICLAYLIYRLERNNEKHAKQVEIERVKRILFALLHNGVNRAFKSKAEGEWENFDFIRITDNHIGMIASIGHLLSEEQFLYLNQVFEALKDISDNEKNGYPGDAKNSVNRLIQLMTVPVYPMYQYYMKNLTNIYDVMSKEAISVFHVLSEDVTQKSVTYGIVYDSGGNKLFESFPDNHYIVYDESGNTICDAIVDRSGIVEGNAKTFVEEGYPEFEGSFHDGKRSGMGIEFLSNGKKGKEGEWQADQLINGIIYDVILDASGKLFIDTNYQVETSRELYDLERYSSELKVGNVRVENGEVEVIEESGPPLRTTGTGTPVHIDSSSG